MTPVKIAVFTLMSIGITAGALVANAPDAFPYMWELKSLTVAATGIAALFMNPAPSTPKS